MVKLNFCLADNLIEIVWQDLIRFYLLLIAFNSLLTESKHRVLLFFCNYHYMCLEKSRVQVKPVVRERDVCHLKIQDPGWFPGARCVTNSAYFKCVSSYSFLHIGIFSLFTIKQWPTKQMLCCLFCINHCWTFDRSLCTIWVAALTISKRISLLDH